MIQTHSSMLEMVVSNVTVVRRNEMKCKGMGRVGLDRIRSYWIRSDHFGLDRIRLYYIGSGSVG